MKLQVFYDGNLDVELDKQIKDFFENLGFKWYGSGYSLVDNKRDIVFSKE